MRLNSLSEQELQAEYVGCMRTLEFYDREGIIGIMKEMVTAKAREIEEINRCRKEKDTGKSVEDNTPSTFEPQSGMWCIQGTIYQGNDKTGMHKQFATFYLHPEVNACSKAGAIRLAEGLLNPFDDPNIVPSVSAHLVDVASVTEKGWTNAELIKMDENVFDMF